MAKYRTLFVALCLLIIVFAVILLNRSLQTTDPNVTNGVPSPINGISEDGSMREAMFYVKLENNQVQCFLCFRGCIIPEGRRGFCRNRENIGGTLFTLVYGKASALNVDPVEKEPLHHFLPGSHIFCIATVGCNFRCKFCQNWRLSQVAPEDATQVIELMPEDVIRMALESGAESISFTYSEPTVFYEYMFDIARLARQNGLGVVVHTNGSMSPEPLRALLLYVDAVTVDLKAFDEDFYQNITGGSLEAVLTTLQIIQEEGVWLEIVNLVIPTLNDDPLKIQEMSQWIYRHLGPNVPLHFSRFFPAYRLTALPATPIETLEEAYDIARQAGLHFVSIGNAPGHIRNSTFCHVCQKTLISRWHFSVVYNRITDGKCSYCGVEIPGIWTR